MEWVKRIEHLFSQYKRMYRPYMNKLNDLLAEYELFVAQWLIIQLLAEKDTLTLVEISHERLVEKPTITRMVRQLKELNYVEFVPGEDKREKRTKLTERGRHVYESARVKIEKLQVGLLNGVTEKQQYEATKVLSIINQNLMK